MMNKILIANWKMHPSTEKEAITLAKAADHAGVIICPPYPFLHAVKSVIKKASLGAQDVCFEAEGPFTGEVSAHELKSLGVLYVIIGHSERRAHANETDEIVAKKVAAALDQKLIPIVCIGETRTEREKGQTREVVDRQLRMALSLIPADSSASGGSEKKYNIILTYEPVWAISTNQATSPATPEIVQDMINYMEGVTRGLPVTPAFIYGGSVDSHNLESFVSCPEIHGALVGGASLKPAEFKKMISIASEIA